MTQDRFDRLLKAMVTYPHTDAAKIAKARRASNAAASEGSGGTQTPKGKSGAISSKPKRKSRTSNA